MIKLTSLLNEIQLTNPKDYIQLTEQGKLALEQQLCFHYTNTQPLFKTTKIAESFGYVNYVGNRDKSKKSIICLN